MKLPIYCPARALIQRNTKEESPKGLTSARSTKGRDLTANTFYAEARDVFVFRSVVLTMNRSMNTAPRWIALAAGIFGFTGVALGAFGAHALKETLTARGSLDIWNKAVLYQLVHAVALLSISHWPLDNIKIIWTARSWMIGVILFSGSLYGLALGGPKILGPITPLGGLAFLIGWLLIAITALRSPKA